jgi:hypothetical protein
MRQCAPMCAKTGETKMYKAPITNAELFQAYLDNITEVIGLPRDNDKTIPLWHGIACAFDWCQENNVDFNSVLAEVREHFAQNE